jgi:hypothetical protein
VFAELFWISGRGQKIHFPSRAKTAGITNNPESKTMKIAIASIGPRDLNDPNEANVRANIATTVVPADPAIEGPTLDIVVLMASHLFELFTSSSRYLETIKRA